MSARNDHTAMSSAFEAAGYSRADMIFFSAAMAYLQAGGEITRAHQLIAHAACKLPGEGHVNHDSQQATAHARQPNRGGAGHFAFATRSLNARPAREPSSSQRAAAGSVAKTVALSVFDSFKLPSGDAPARTPFHRLERLLREHEHGVALLRLIKEQVPNADPYKTPADYLSERQYQRLIQKAAEVADAA